MARPRQVDMALVAQAHALAIEAATLEDLRCAQAVLLPALLDATLEDTAAALRAEVAEAHRHLRLHRPPQKDHVGRGQGLHPAGQGL